MREEHVVQRVGDRKDEVEVGPGQKVLSPGLLPARALEPLALRAVPVAARVVGDLGVPAAAVTLPEVASQRCRAAARERRDDPALLCRQATEPVTVGQEDVRQLRATLPGHPGGTSYSAAGSASAPRRDEGSLTRCPPAPFP